MTFPAFILGALIATTYGTLFHLWRGGNLGRLVLYIVLSWIGFWSGHIIGHKLGISIVQIGPLYAGTATIMCAICLTVGYWLSLIEVRDRKKR